MALIKCNECEKTYNDKYDNCPECDTLNPKLVKARNLSIISLILGILSFPLNYYAILPSIGLEFSVIVIMSNPSKKYKVLTYIAMILNIYVLYIKYCQLIDWLM